MVFATSFRVQLGRVLLCGWDQCPRSPKGYSTQGKHIVLLQEGPRVPKSQMVIARKGTGLQGLSFRVQGQGFRVQVFVSRALGFSVLGLRALGCQGLVCQGSGCLCVCVCFWWCVCALLFRAWCQRVQSFEGLLFVMSKVLVFRFQGLGFQGLGVRFGGLASLGWGFEGLVFLC